MSLRRIFTAFLLVVSFLAIDPSSSSAADTPLITAGSIWRYLDNGSNQGILWRGVGFNDSAWASGPAQLGYGDGDEATVVSFGPDTNNKYITTYFRKTFNITNPSQFTSLTLRMIRDDGPVVYVNGTEVWRLNLPTGNIAYNTLALAAVVDETTWQTVVISPSVLVAGTNTIAVEMHQNLGTSSDISFDFSMTASDTASVTRGPYLQLGTHDAMTVRWRTDAATDSQVRFGTTQGVLTGTVTDGVPTTEHEVRITGLLPDTKYFYEVGTTVGGLSGNDAATFFYTNPTPGTVRPYRFWVIGDAGTGNTEQINVRNAFSTFNGSTRTDAWLMLGDNAYDTGTDAEFQSKVYNIYPSMFKNSVVWPALGNHDTAQSTNPPASIPYFQMFTLPTNAEAGGFPSGTEKYYSFDYGNIHFIELDSMASSRSSTGAMANWLSSDLAQNTKRWTVAYWHHAPYTFGTHNSDTEIELAEMRANLNPILENGRVDLVLSGHSHSYERSFLIDGHYGTSSTFTPGMKLDATGGPYSKAGVNAHEGTVYIVAGTSGRLGSLMAQAPYPAMFSSRTEAGSLVMDVNGDQMVVRFLTQAGAVVDTVTINKSVVVTPPAAPSGLTATTISASQIDLAWVDNSSNEDGFKIERSTDNINFSQIASVGAGTTNYPNTGLAAGTLYYYRVFAYNSAGNSASPSNTASATTTAVVPNAPSGLTATTISSSQINLAWVDNSSNEDGFKIERSTDNVNFSQIASVGAGTTNYPNTGLVAGTLYYYRVFAYNSAGNSAAPSNTASATTTAPPAAPSGLTATTISSSQIDLAWVDNSSNEDGFKIERSTDNINFSQIASVGAGTTSYPNTGLAAGTLYYYRVFAYNTAGNSASPSNTASATTAAPTVTTLLSAGSSWRYEDKGSNLGTAWRATNFNDGSWPSGAAELGYGDGGEATTVSFGPNSKKKYITTYFRQSITVTNPAQFTTLNLSMIRDDGAVVYINGVEVWRTNMPASTINWKTQASSATDNGNESTWFSTTLAPSALVAGTNVIAVEIHQVDQTSSDISFDLKLTAQ